MFITHDPKCAGYADQIVTIADGALCSETEPVETPAPAASIQTAAPKISMLKRAVKNFMLRLPRYTAIALAMSLGVLCFTLSLSSGNLIKQSIADFEAKNTAYHNGYIPVEDNADSLYTLLSQDQRLEAVYLQYVLSQVSVTVGDQTVEMPEKYPMAKAKQQLSYGVMPRRGAAELALSPSLAAKFDKQIQNLVGKSAEVCYNGQRFSVTISGIFNAPYDDFFISSDLEQQFYEAQQGPAYSITYDVREFEDIVPVSVQLAEQQLSSQNAAAEVAAFQSTFRQLNRLFLTVSMLIFAVGLLISGILLMKQQRTRAHELALLSALGYRKGNIQAMVAFETLLLALGAALLTLGLTGTAILAGTAAGFPLILTLPQVLTALCLTLVLSLAIGFLSSFKVLRTDPAIALRS